MPESPKPSSANWQGSLSDTSWVYYQGRNSSQTHAARYIGNHYLATTTAETAQFQPPTIFTIPRESLWLYPEIPEVDKTPKEACNSWSLSSAYFAIKRYFQNTTVRRMSTDYTPLYPQDEDGSLKYYQVDHQQCSLGQETDKQAHKARVLNLQKHRPQNKKTIIYGVSRGAATSFAALADNHQHYQNIKLCILEAPPESMQDIIQSYLKNQSLGTAVYQNFGQYILGAQHSTKPSAQAGGHVAHYPNHIPTVIISSVVDEVVPHQNTLRLALAVAAKRLLATQQNQAEVAPLYFLQLDSASHNTYISRDSKDGTRYQSFIHALYKKYDLPHIESFANNNKENSELVNFTSPLMAPLVLAQQQYWDNKSSRQSIRDKALKNLTHCVKTNTQLSIEDKLRLIKLATAMPLFASKLPQNKTWFWQSGSAICKLKKLADILKLELEMATNPSSTVTL